MPEMEMRRGIVLRWKTEPKPGDRFGVLFLERDPNPYAGAIGEGVEPGDEVAFLAIHNSHPRYGDQYKVQKVVMHLPGKRNLVNWVLQRMPQIGPIRAKAMQEKFGAEIWEVLEHNPMRLTEIDGIGEERAMAAQQCFMLERASIATYTWLLNMGVDPKILLTLLRKKVSPSELREFVEHDPYQLLRWHGIKFDAIDEIGRARQIDKDDPRRICGAVVHVLREKKRDGHTAVPYNIVRMETRNLVKRPDAIIDNGFAQVETLPFPAHFTFFGNRVQWSEAAEDDRLFAQALGIEVTPSLTAEQIAGVDSQIAEDSIAAEHEFAQHPQWALKPGDADGEV